ncbi:hypothetical protein [Staphylococcus epidermidis]|uniref:hypothetical protein n=1 Tax=Staphylococcus epidermidis TaxID=1282 RepID=UPI0021B2DD58|nr:hypothetical protein [Staphylococcus epidermidis]
MNGEGINDIDDELRRDVWEEGFDVEGGSRDDNKRYIEDIDEYKKKGKVLSELEEEIERKKELLRDMKDLEDEKEDLSGDIEKLKGKNDFLEEDCEEGEEDMEVYKEVRGNCREDFEKDEEK